MLTSLGSFLSSFSWYLNMSWWPQRKRQSSFNDSIHYLTTVLHKGQVSVDILFSFSSVHRKGGEDYAAQFTQWKNLHKCLTSPSLHLHLWSLQTSFCRGVLQVWENILALVIWAVNFMSGFVLWTTFRCNVTTCELEDRTKENRHIAMKSILVQRTIPMFCLPVELHSNDLR